MDGISRNRHKDKVTGQERMDKSIGDLSHRNIESNPSGRHEFTEVTEGIRERDDGRAGSFVVKREMFTDPSALAFFDGGHEMQYGDVLNYLMALEGYGDDVVSRESKAQITLAILAGVHGDMIKDERVQGFAKHLMAENEQLATFLMSKGLIDGASGDSSIALNDQGDTEQQFIQLIELAQDPENHLKVLGLARNLLESKEELSTFDLAPLVMIIAMTEEPKILKPAVMLLNKLVSRVTSVDSDIGSVIKQLSEEERHKQNLSVILKKIQLIESGSSAISLDSSGSFALEKANIIKLVEAEGHTEETVRLIIDFYVRNKESLLESMDIESHKKLIGYMAKSKSNELKTKGYQILAEIMGAQKLKVKERIPLLEELLAFEREDFSDVIMKAFSLIGDDGKINEDQLLDVASRIMQFQPKDHELKSNNIYEEIGAYLLGELVKSHSSDVNKRFIAIESLLYLSNNTAYTEGINNILIAFVEDSTVDDSLRATAMEKIKSPDPELLSKMRNLLDVDKPAISFQASKIIIDTKNNQYLSDALKVAYLIAKNESINSELRLKAAYAFADSDAVDKNQKLEICSLIANDSTFSEGERIVFAEKLLKTDFSVESISSLTPSVLTLRSINFLTKVQYNLYEAIIFDVTLSSAEKENVLKNLEMVFADKPEWQTVIIQHKSRMMAHFFSINSTNQGSLNLEGYQNSQTYKEMMDSLQALPIERESDFDIDFVQRLLGEGLDYIMGQDGDKLLGDLQPDVAFQAKAVLPCTLALVNPGVDILGFHSVSLVIYDGYVIKCNRGAGADLVDERNALGIEIFQLNPEHPGQLEDLAERLSKGDYEAWAGVNEKEGFIPILKFKRKGQSAQNCTWASTKTALLALLMCSLNAKNPEKYPLETAADFEKALAAALVIYKEWSLNHRINAVKDYKQLEGHHEELLSDSSKKLWPMAVRRLTLETADKTPEKIQENQNKFSDLKKYYIETLGHDESSLDAMTAAEVSRFQSKSSSGA